MDVRPYCHDTRLAWVLDAVCPRTCLRDEPHLLHMAACFAGHCDISECAQVQPLCHDKHYGHVVRALCAKTCAPCHM